MLDAIERCKHNISSLSTIDCESDTAKTEAVALIDVLTTFDSVVEIYTDVVKKYEELVVQK